MQGFFTGRDESLDDGMQLARMWSGSNTRKGTRGGVEGGRWKGMAKEKRKKIKVKKKIKEGERWSEEMGQGSMREREQNRAEQ